MDKIKQLLLKTGLSEEAATSICESLNTYEAELRNRLEEEFKVRVEAAKKVCIDETRDYERQLAHRVQIFCEAKGPAIEQAYAKSIAGRETLATSKLQEVKSLLEGVELNGQAASQSQFEEMRRQLMAERQERQKAVTKFNQKNAIAERVIHKNGLLTAEVAQLKRQLAEQGPKPQRQSQQRSQQRQPVAEGRQRRTQAPQNNRIDQGRQQGRPVTSRAILENTNRPTRNGGNTTSVGGGIDYVADHMDDVI